MPLGAVFFLEAYRDLVTCRVPDGPIPWTAVTLYADKAELEPDTAKLLWSVVNILDARERNWVTNNTLSNSQPTRPEGEQ